MKLGVEKNLFLMANKLSENYNINVLSANKEKRKMFVKKVKFYSTKYIDLNNVNLDENATQKVKSVEEVKTIKKTKTGPKKTGWWSQ